MRTLHTFGDSHGGGYPDHGWSKVVIDNLHIVTHWIGPITCAYFGVRRLEVLDISKFDVTDGNIICFSFGEIDVRSINKIKEDRYDFIDGVVERYFEAIELNVCQFKDLKVIVQSVTPACKAIDYFDQNWLVLGTDAERKSYTEHFNLRYEQGCEKYGYSFLDFYKKYCDEDGFLNKSLSDGHAHIREPEYIKLKLMEILDKI